MNLTNHEIMEFARCAQAMYQRGCNAQGHTLSAIAANRVVSTEEYDRASRIYRNWLVFNVAN